MVSLSDSPVAEAALAAPAGRPALALAVKLAAESLAESPESPAESLVESAESPVVGAAAAVAAGQRIL